MIETDGISYDEQNNEAVSRDEKKKSHSEYRREKRLARIKRKGKILTVRFLIFLLVIALAVFGYLYVDGKLDKWFPNNDREGFLPDSVLGYTTFEFRDAILGETKTLTEVVVLEQAVSVDTTITNALANLAIFQKTKVIHSYGTGVYTIDLSALSADAISVSRIQKTVTITIPSATLKYVNIDAAATTFEETEHALLGFGDIKLTQEQQKALDTSIDAAMREELTKEEHINCANEAAKTVIAELLKPYVSSVSEEYTVIIKIK